MTQMLAIRRAVINYRRVFTVSDTTQRRHLTVTPSTTQGGEKQVPLWLLPFPLFPVEVCPLKPARGSGAL